MDQLMTAMQAEGGAECGGNPPGRVGRTIRHALGSALFRVGRAWLPLVNLYELDEEFLVCVDLAGTQRDEIDVAVKDGVLRVAGCRRDPLPGGKRVHLLEIDEGFFCREVEIPASVVIDRIEATYEEGFLWVHLPKG
jgi:HSP20 family molecular chaperone IbpA